ncbi:uncharacterized protein BDZ99DRAFT_524816 [Mytilinidion resinicola]|uniref:Uncharacterized protein n=1 Tax=Mytilinidion resinicola TaxID=574789 RepID=A0A6A6Y8D2_9PEZI|nr:uncharacterized protein BDZ99DRAFT_524816 [Mytilinidion resinicola]KAF2805096.1 hypothetical protein BDZ99DRAFT_524816 [Mytilinidion resinicola]
MELAVKALLWALFVFFILATIGGIAVCVLRYRRPLTRCNNRDEETGASGQAIELEDIQGVDPGPGAQGNPEARPLGTPMIVFQGRSSALFVGNAGPASQGTFGAAFQGREGSAFVQGFGAGPGSMSQHPPPDVSPSPPASVASLPESWGAVTEEEAPFESVVGEPVEDNPNGPVVDPVREPAPERSRNETVIGIRYENTAPGPPRPPNPNATGKGSLGLSKWYRAKTKKTSGVNTKGRKGWDGGREGETGLDFAIRKLLPGSL